MKRLILVSLLAFSIVFGCGMHPHYKQKLRQQEKGEQPKKKKKIGDPLQAISDLLRSKKAPPRKEPQQTPWWIKTLIMLAGSMPATGPHVRHFYYGEPLYLGDLQTELHEQMWSPYHDRSSQLRRIQTQLDRVEQQLWELQLQQDDEWLWKDTWR